MQFVYLCVPIDYLYFLYIIVYVSLFVYYLLSFSL